MLRTTRLFVLTLVASTAFGAAACSGSNDSPTGGSSGASTTTTGGTSSTAIAGTASSTAGTTSSVAGTGSSAAGAGSSAAGTGSGTAGTSSTAGTGSGGSGTAGSSGTGGAATSAFTPLCKGLMTAGAMEPAKAVACTAADAQVCYKSCGPQSTGFKSETCTAGAYAEQSGCAFPPELDAACFKLPATQDASCPATPPQASMDCTVAECTLCNGGGGPTGTYLDSKGASKAGYCVCPAAGASGSRKWSCASTDAWPCPGGKGC
jgi:hypothetical protein